jgi:hypothetical protein
MQLLRWLSETLEVNAMGRSSEAATLRCLSLEALEAPSERDENASARRPHEAWRQADQEHWSWPALGVAGLG